MFDYYLLLGDESVRDSRRSIITPVIRIWRHGAIYVWGLYPFLRRWRE